MRTFFLALGFLLLSFSSLFSQIQPTNSSVNSVIFAIDSIDYQQLTNNSTIGSSYDFIGIFDGQAVFMDIERGLETRLYAALQRAFPTPNEKQISLKMQDYILEHNTVAFTYFDEPFRKRLLLTRGFAKRSAYHFRFMPSSSSAIGHEGRFFNSQIINSGCSWRLFGPFYYSGYFEDTRSYSPTVFTTYTDAFVRLTHQQNLLFMPSLSSKKIHLSASVGMSNLLFMERRFRSSFGFWF